VRAEGRRRPADVDRHEAACLVDASQQQHEANAQEAHERAVDAIAGQRRLGGFEQATGERQVAGRERHFAARGEDARTHRIAGRQPALRALEQYLRGAVLAELRHRHPAQRQGWCVVARADEAQRGQGVEAREVSRGHREIGIVSQLLLPGRGDRAVHQDA